MNHLLESTYARAITFFNRMSIILFIFILKNLVIIMYENKQPNSSELL